MYAVYLIPIFWLIFIVYWFIAAMSAKRTIRTRTWWYGGAIRIIAFIILIIVLQEAGSKTFLAHVYGNALNINPVLSIIGTILVALGIALAIWARVYLGRNWGMPMSVKENPELVTSGPYRFVRNPIYTGMLLALFGSAIAGNGLWIILFVFFGVYFIYSATREDQMLLKQFPDQYPAYKKRTKMLIPFVL